MGVGVGGKSYTHTYVHCCWLLPCRADTIVRREYRAGAKGQRTMKTPAGVAAITGITVALERKLLQLTRKYEAGTHTSPMHKPFCPYTLYFRVGPRWISAAQLILLFRQGQRHKTRVNKAKTKARAKAREGAAAAKHKQPERATHLRVTTRARPTKRKRQAVTAAAAAAAVP